MSEKSVDQFSHREALYMSIKLLQDVENCLLDHEAIKSDKDNSILAQQASDALFKLCQIIAKQASIAKQHTTPDLSLLDGDDVREAVARAISPAAFAFQEDLSGSIAIQERISRARTKAQAAIDAIKRIYSEKQDAAK